MAELQPTPTVTRADMEDQRVIRFNEMKRFNVAFVDSLIPEHQKQNFKVIGTGMVEDKRATPPIPGDHGFSMSFIACKPGCGAGLHIHNTAEVFVPLDGKLSVYWGDNGEEEVILNPWDTISVPSGIYRGFRNAGDTDLTILAVVSDDKGGGPITWHPEVLDRAKETGLAVENGKLIKLDNYALPEGMTEIEGE